MRCSALALLLGLAACSSGPPPLQLSRPPPPPPPGQPTVRVVDAALASGAPDLALRVVHDILARHPDDADAWVRQGDALYMLRRVPEASDSYTRALALAPHSNLAKLGLGRSKLPTDAAAAETMFLEVTQSEPRNGAAFNDLGIARDLQGRHAAAQAAYAAALALTPDMIAAQVNLGLSLALSGQTDRALSILRPLAARSEATPRVRQDLAVALALAGNESEAEQVLRADQPGDAAPNPILLPHDAPATPPAPAAPAAPAATAPAPATTPAAMAPPPAPAPVLAAAAPRPAPQAVATRPDAPATRTAAASPPAASPPAAAKPERPQAAERRIAIRADGDAWVEVRDTAGQVYINRMLHAGDSWRVPARAPDEPALLLTTGNAGHTVLLVDGAEAPRIGRSDTVVRDLALEPDQIRKGHLPAQVATSRAAAKAEVPAPL